MVAHQGRQGCNNETRNTSFWAEIDGQRLHYQKAGSGPPLLLIHGLLGGSFCWRFNISELSARRTVYAIDLAGQGLSDAPSRTDCGMRAQAARVTRFVDANHLGDVDVVASSWGGAIALLLAAQDARVRSLVLAAPVNPWSLFGRDRVRFFSGRLGASILRLALPFSGRIQREGLERMYGDPAQIRPGTVEGYSAILRRRGRAANLINIMRCWEQDVKALSEAIPRVQAPTLLIWGSRDGAVDPRSAQPLQRFLPNGWLEMLPGIGHLPFEESPEVFNRLVLDFIERQR
jgi:pimeloyl-ACP methyl ester carboxylesterase